MEENRQSSREEEKPGGASGKAHRHRASYGRVRRAPELRRAERCSDASQEECYRRYCSASRDVCDPRAQLPPILEAHAASTIIPLGIVPTVRQVADDAGEGECKTTRPTTKVRQIVDADVGHLLPSSPHRVGWAPADLAGLNNVSGNYI